MWTLNRLSKPYLLFNQSFVLFGLGFFAMSAPQHPASKLLTASTAQSAGSKRGTPTLALTCAVLFAVTPITATAAPTVVVNNEEEQTAAAADPQVAPQPDSPFNETNQQNANNEQAADALQNPDSLASDMHPSDTDLSAANQQLLSRNAQLQRDVNDLQTRVNVLINERSGQLFMYGAVTVAVSLFLGVLLGGFIFSRRGRW